jgi:penicillin-binding protein 1A
MLRMMRAVVAPGGTGAAAAALNHPLAGKTGTTSDFADAWFVGYSPSITCGVWVGYDNRTPLGKNESGGIAALPIWMGLLRVADAQHPDETFPGG